MAALLGEHPGQMRLGGRWLGADQVEAASPTINSTAVRRRRPGDALGFDLAIQTALIAAGPVAFAATRLL